jgi:hypothetical protein
MFIQQYNKYREGKSALSNFALNEARNLALYDFGLS